LFIVSSHFGGAMKLADYLDNHGLTKSDFAEIIGVSEETIRRYIKGTRIPERETMEKIALATACKVTANDFFGMAA
jgi:transcriptional regulator with XRE-family HTH domain